jgi:hypothetical protein
MIHPARVLLLTILAIACLAFAQKSEEVLVSFSGSLKIVSKKEITIEPEPDNEMTFVRTKKTKFLSGGKPVDASRIGRGTVVRVDAVQKLNGDLEAVNVAVVLDGDQSPNK